MPEPIPATPFPYVHMNEVKRVPIEWIWYPYIPRKATSLIVGDGGYGKSFLTCAIAADLSAGRALPGQDALPPMKILIVNAEDSCGETLLPRLQSLDANLENIMAYEDGFTLNDKTIKKLFATIEECDVAIMFLDPMVVYLGGGMDINKANETRSILSELTAIAKERNIAVVGVHHVKKAQGGSQQHKSLGSVDFVNGVRSLLLVDISKTGQHYMAHAKSNWAAKGCTLAYSFTGDKFSWLGEYAPIVDQTYEISKTPRGKARAFLIGALRDGPVRGIEVIKRGHDEELSEGTIQRAKRGVVKSFQKDGHWWWELEPECMPHPEPIGVKPTQLLKALGDTIPEVTVTKTKAAEPESDMQRIIREAREKLK
jgi:hypothetical protein